MAHGGASPILQIRSLSRRFGPANVFQDLDLEVTSGERVALTGPNGSGKTTLLKCIAGTLTPSSGAINVGGAPAGSLAARGRVGVALSQERSFYLRLTGTENLVFFARLLGRSPRDARRHVANLCDELEIRAVAARRVDRCSKGMTQQLSFARALLGDPQLLLLDEPTSSMDDAAVERFWRALDERSHIAAIVASHRHDDVDRCDRTVSMDASAS